ncbi:lipoate--protein ligase family protein [Pseudoalteromonas denitrificans]|uniref:Lipoate-protein ligase A n=1 Tax=Pseudoalteromonas denitrificans DSM 6059 TaxID=1123010 RepID=A0A1I1NR29_9GAMM|nr:lipoate--protein ligase [Pseudoalteromonas denitrificans]SFC97978.1 Lipoate-protein ligase A [Pseudoalteromonas denitrificans DSM 6059]
MNKSRNKLVRFNHIKVESAFEKEAQLLKQVQNDELDQCLILWQAKNKTLVLPAGNKWPKSDELKQALLQKNWQLLCRKTGGAPVPQCPGVINLSHIYTWPTEKTYSITLAYQNLCSVLNAFFEEFGLTSQAHTTEFSYCDGDYNLNINGKKIVGTAQRVILKKGGGKIVLAQAFILIDVLLDELIKPVNLCYQVCNKTERVKAKVHTSLFDNMNERPNIDALYQMLTQAFIKSGLYN